VRSRARRWAGRQAGRPGLVGPPRRGVAAAHGPKTGWRAWRGRRHPPHPSAQAPGQAFPSSIFRDKNRCDIGKSQPKWTAKDGKAWHTSPPPASAPAAAPEAAAAVASASVAATANLGCPDLPASASASEPAPAHLRGARSAPPPAAAAAACCCVLSHRAPPTKPALPSRDHRAPRAKQGRGGGRAARMYGRHTTGGRSTRGRLGGCSPVCARPVGRPRHWPPRPAARHRRPPCAGRPTT
jgi:hypothetical protein